MAMRWLGYVRAGFRDGLRPLRSARVHSALVVAILATGLAAATAMFTVVRAVVLRQLPFPEPHRLVALQEYQSAHQRDQASVSFADLGDYRAATRTLSGIAAFGNSEFVLSGDAPAERVLGAGAESSLFSVLGTIPFQGRFFSVGDDGPTPAHVVVISWALWQRRFGGDRALVGRSILLDGESYTVIGVTPAHFEFPRSSMMDRDVELWVPLAVSPMAATRRSLRNLTALARLRPGVSVDGAQAELVGIAARIAGANKQTNDGWSVRLIPLRDMMIGRVRGPMLLVSFTVLALLVIVGVNTAAATLARASTRTRGLATRLALGADRWVIVRLLIAESMVLGVVAGVVALPLSAVLRRLLVAAAPVAIPRQGGIALDVGSGVAAIGTAILLGAAAALLPAWYLTRADLRTFIADTGRGATMSRGLRAALWALVAGQLAIATALLGGSLAIASHYRALNRIDPGFRADGIITASLPLRGARYATGAARSDLTDRYLDRLRQIPGISTAAITSLLPLGGGLMSTNYAIVGGDPADTLETAALRAVSSEFFSTFGIPLRSGRLLEPHDDGGAPLVAVVNSAFVRQSLRDQAAVGSAVRVTAPGMDSAADFRIVGVVADAREKDLTSGATPIVYFSNRQVSFPHVALAVRATSAVSAVQLRRALADLDPSLALDDVTMLTTRVRATYALATFLLQIIGGFAAFAVVLVAMGVYATVSCSVTADTRATGIRLALGATRGQVVLGALRRLGLLAVVACGIGTGGLLLLRRALPVESIGSSPVSPLLAVAAGGGVLAIAFTAAFVPMWSAANADPVKALRG